MISLKFAYSKGYKTSVSIEPFLDYDPTKLIEAVTPYTTESIWLGKMNYIPLKNISSEEQVYYEKIRKNYEFEHLLYIFNTFRNQKLIRFKDSIINKIGMTLKLN